MLDIKLFKALIVRKIGYREDSEKKDTFVDAWERLHQILGLTDFKLKIEDLKQDPKRKHLICSHQSHSYFQLQGKWMWCVAHTKPYGGSPMLMEDLFLTNLTHLLWRCRGELKSGNQQI